MEFDINNVEFHLNFQKKKKSGKIYINLDIANVEFHNSILLQLSLKNRDIFLNSFKINAICYIVHKLGVNAHFPLVMLDKTVYFTRLVGGEGTLNRI